MEKPFYKKPFDKWSAPAKVGAIGAVAIVLYGLYSFFKSDKTDSTTLSFCDSVKKQNLTHSEVYYNVLSDTIYAAVWLYYDGVFEDDEAIQTALLECQNEDDVLQLICAYGVRGPDYIGLDRTLIETIQFFLDEDKKTAVNAEYTARGINFKWL